MDYKSWTHIFTALQKISDCAHRVEGETTSQVPQFHFGLVAKRIAENMKKYSPKGMAPIKEKSELSKSVQEENKEDDSAANKSGTASLTEEEEKAAHINKIHPFGVKTLASPKGHPEKIVPSGIFT